MVKMYGFGWIKNFIEPNEGKTTPFWLNKA